MTRVRTRTLRLAASSSTWTLFVSGQKYCTKLSRLFRTLCSSFFFFFESDRMPRDGTTAKIWGIPCAWSERRHSSPHDPGSIEVSADSKRITKSAQRQASMAGKSAPYGMGKNCTT